MTVQPADVATDLGRSTSPQPGSVEFEQFTMWINEAMLLLRVGDGAHAGLGNLSLLDQETLDYVVRKAVVAHARRPDNATQVSVSVDDASSSRSYSTSKGQVVIDGWMWDMLSPTAAPDGAFSVRPSFQPDRPAWC